MKYFDTPVEEQETTINICYEDETVQIYSNRVDVIKNLTHNIGKPTKRDKRGKTYWLGATWEIPFSDRNGLRCRIFSLCGPVRRPPSGDARPGPYPRRRWPEYHGSFAGILRLHSS